VRKLECTYNVHRDDYHPHLHVVTSTREQAELLRSLWLAKHSASECTPDAQDVRACGRETLNEVFKYFTKITTPATGKSGRAAAPPAVLDVIFQAMRGKRVYQPLGFVLPKERDEERTIDDGPGTPSPSKRPAGEAVTWEWSQHMGDWIDYGTGEVLADYHPTVAFRRFVDGIAPPEECDVDGPP
jgi:hypothetical protein